MCAGTLGPDDGEAPAAWKLSAFSCTSGRGVRVADLGRGSPGKQSQGSVTMEEEALVEWLILSTHSIATLNRERPCCSLGSEALVSLTWQCSCPEHSFIHTGGPLLPTESIN